MAGTDVPDLASADVEVNACGLRCPKPLVEARKRLNRMIGGQVLALHFDHSISKGELPKAFAESGDPVLSLTDRAAGGWTILVRKGDGHA